MLMDFVKAWEFIMDAWASRINCGNHDAFEECVKRFEVVCSPWPVFFNYINNSWIIPQRNIRKTCL